MYCPQCRVAYRPGFTHCTDCDVCLVYELPPAKTVSSESDHAAPPSEDTEDPFCSFWQGDHPRLHAELCMVLDEAGIAHKTIRRQDHLFNLNNYPAFPDWRSFFVVRESGGGGEGRLRDGWFGS